MIKVLDKAFGILEAVVTAAPEPLTPAILAEQLQLNKPTCSRIIKELVEAGYLQQVSRQSGYLAGPRAFSLGQHTDYETELRTAAAEPIYRCAQTIGQSVLLAVMYQGGRYILLHHNFNPAMKIDLRQLAYRDLFATATGLVLLAYASEPEFELARTARSPSESPELNIACHRREDAVFQEIRRDRKFVYEGPDHPFAIIAFPVFRRNRFVAALGMSAPHPEFVGAERQQMLELVGSTAETISRQISGLSSVG